MRRWNIDCICFYSHDEQRRKIDFLPGQLNVIVGPSGTGKSAIIKTVDYCLGSKNCEIPQHVVDRCSLVAIKWVCGDLELLVARPIPVPGRKSSSTMYVAFGEDISIPSTTKEFPGRTSLADGKTQIERLFGIGDVLQEQRTEGERPERVTIRHAVPYMFLAGDIITSDSMLFRGSGDRFKSDDIANTIEYFLGILDEGSLAVERKIRQLRKALDIQTRREREAESKMSVQMEEALSLVAELRQVGVVHQHDPETLEEARQLLDAAARWTPEVVSPVAETEIDKLYEKQESVLAELNRLQKEYRHATKMAEDAIGFSDTVKSQKEKLELVDLLDESAFLGKCPICDSDVNQAMETVEKVRKAFFTLSGQSEVIEVQSPHLRQYLEDLGQVIDRLRNDKTIIDRQIRSILQDEERVQHVLRANQKALRVIGRVSYFLDQCVESAKVSGRRKSDDIRDELEGLQAQWNPEIREEERKIAESTIAKDATSLLGKLPVEEPLKKADLHFFVKSLHLTVQDASDRTVSFGSVGSDQNYLALHIALFLALHRFFAKRRRPVPGTLIIDQISRPYFPYHDRKKDFEIGAESRDPDSIAMRRHIDFLLEELDRQTDLQVILLEHAYISDIPRYVSAVRERWSTDLNEKLIPADWPIMT